MITSLALLYRKGSVNKAAKKMGDKENLEMEKLRVEVDLLKNELAGKKADKSKLLKIREWLPSILTFVGILGGLATFILTANNYLVELRKENERARSQYEVSFNNEIISMSRDLLSEDPLEREYAVLMLTSYELDAVPVIMYLLERIEIIGRGREADVGIYLQTLRNIYHKNRDDTYRDVFFELVLNASRELFLREYADMNMKEGSDQLVNMNGIANHFRVIQTLGPDLEEKQVQKLHELIELVKDKLGEKKIHTSIVNAINHFIEDVEDSIAIS